MDNSLAILAHQFNRRSRKPRRHRRSYFRLEYRNRYPDPEKYY